MKKVINNFIAWLKQSQRKAKLAEKIAKENSICEESKKVIQIMEYNGMLYVCYKELPLLPINTLKESVNDTLRTARQVYIEYKLEHHG
nr:MAG TPA: hypothetical protein [Bacteriophage sp.]